MSSPELPRINVTSLSQFVRYNNCERYLRLRLRSDEERQLRQRWGITVQPLTPLLRETGLEFEQAVETAVENLGEQVVRLGDDAPVSETLAWLRVAQAPVVLLQVPLEARLGHYQVNGIADLIRLWRDDSGGLHLFVADIKSSVKEKMEHRLQVALYVQILQEMVAAEGLAFVSINGRIIHAGDPAFLESWDFAAPGFDLLPYITTLNQLLVEDSSTIARIAELPFEEVFYHLGPWCDGCLYNAHCFYDAAERQDLSLVPALSAMEKRALHNAGIRTLPQLASLMDLPEKGSATLTVPLEQAEVYQRVNQQWAVGPQLPLIVQRARRALRRFDASVNAPPFLYGSGFGTLPDEEAHPGLVKIFLDAQYDYLQQRVYLASALITGPKGEQTVVRSLDQPPTAESERDLLLDWVQGILQALLTVTDRSDVFLHLYSYNSYDQRVLLEAFKRHLDEVALLPGFFDLMTQSPAVTQPIISFLAKELEERKNLGALCLPLHDAARALGFDWSDGDVAYYALFRARMFDNRRDIVRRYNGEIIPAPPDVPRGDPRRATIESASRFNSQIPLEYVYAAWGRLDQQKPEDERLLASFRNVTLEHLRGFAARRLYALAHIEGSFKVKSRYLDKERIDINSLFALLQPAPSRAQSLQQFLFMEHYAAFQGKLQVYSLPIERRVQTGLALLLRYKEYDDGRDVYRFAIETSSLGLDAQMVMSAFRLKEGSWVVFNEATETSASRLKNGRLGLVVALGESWLELSLLDISFGKGSSFRFFHNRNLTPELGGLYTIDEMADDMNADKQLAALAQASGNTLYRWLGKRPEQYLLEDDTRGTMARIVSMINELAAPASLTASQHQVIADSLAEPLLLVQGPPGTGKSYTLGWAIIARLLLHAAQGRPCRIAVSSKTHKAVNIVLDSVSQKWLQAAGMANPAGGPFPHLGLFKLVNDPGDDAPDGVNTLSPYNEGRLLDTLLGESFLIIGGTPGGLYNLAKYREAGGRNKVDWQDKLFDWVIIDEASQMSQPEGLLAAAWLKDEGQMIVVGDHRQMPPIIAHNWEEEELRTAVAALPHLSLFETLLNLNFPRASLDESFRLHKTMAQFLQENIYVHDGIQFYSRRTRLLPEGDFVDEYVRRVLDPSYPIVVIEHDERGSQQYNLTELRLVLPLVRACQQHLGLNGTKGLGIVVPHRAQKALLCQEFPELAEAQAIDTVERFQGGERDVIIVSATASDPDYVLAEADFLLNLNRLNVALSRPKQKLIVVASRSVTNLLVSDLAIFENAVIWKRLYYQYASELIWHRNGSMQVWVRGHLTNLTEG